MSQSQRAQVKQNQCIPGLLSTLFENCSTEIEKFKDHAAVPIWSYMNDSLPFEKTVGPTTENNGY